MADFSFLNEDQEEESVPRQGSYKVDLLKPTVQEGQPVEKDEIQAGFPESDLGKTLREEKPDQYIKKRAALEDSIKKASGEGVERLGIQVRANPNIFGFDPESLKTELGGLHPAQHATRLWQETQKYKVPSPNGGMTVDEKAVLDPVEQATVTYNKFLRENAPEEQALQAGLAGQDLPNLKNHIQVLSNAIQKTQEELSVAATPRQKAELQDQLNNFQSRLREFQQKANQLQAKQPSEASPTLAHMAIAAGMPPDELPKAYAEVARMVQAHGLKLEDPIGPGMGGILYTNMVRDILRPDIRDNVLADIPMGPKPREEAPRRGAGAQEGVSEVSSIEAKYRAQADAVETQRQQTFQTLMHSPTFKNVGDMIGFLLTSILVGPHMAAHFFSNMEKNGNLRYELDQLNHQSQQLMHYQHSYMQLKEQARERAASAEETGFHHQAMEDAAYQRIRAAGKGLRDPADISMHNAIQAEYRSRKGDLDISRRQYGRDQKELEDVQKVAANPLHPKYQQWTVPDPKTKKSYLDSMIEATKRNRLILEQKEAAFQKWEETMRAWYQKKGIDLAASEPNPRGTPVLEGQGNTFSMPE